MNNRKRILTLLINGVLLSSLCVASAADTTTGSGNGIAYGTGSTANNTLDVALGNKANVENYVGQNGSVAIGANAHVENHGRWCQKLLWAWGKHHILDNLWSSARCTCRIHLR